MASFTSVEESERYDRQIRVWGAEAQSRIQKSNVLICGMRDLNIEVTKNIVLAGMNITIQDSELVTGNDLSNNYFLTANDIGKNRSHAVFQKVQELNSFVKMELETKSLSQLADSFFLNFSVIEEAIRINKICRDQNPQIIFFWSSVFGEESLFYSDFGDEFNYKEDTIPNSNNNNNNTTIAPKVIKTINFPSLEKVLSKKWNIIPSRFFPLSPTFVKHRLLTSFCDQYKRFPTIDDISKVKEILSKLADDNEIASISTLISDDDVEIFCNVSNSASVMVCSVLGSYLSQEIVKAVSMTGVPAKNVFTFGPDYVAKAFPID